ncbi:MAG: class I SAM-dependent methyltransferase [Flavobacteriales bacterium]
MIYLNSMDNIDQKNQIQTQETFSEKWSQFEQGDKKEEVYSFQKEWFLELYGFDSEESLKQFLSSKNTIIDTGCGLGYKAAWFAELAPHALVVGVDISEAATIAAKNYKHLSNLYFYQADIAKTGIKENSIDFTVCDQVIMHTEDPETTFAHLTSITYKEGVFACYVYRKKALPRELLDDYFRSATHDIPNEQLWEMSSQLTELGKRLSELEITFDSPDIPLLGIKGGKQDLQRFIYWNFIKCFWREDWGKEMSDATNFDWYAPSNAKRYSKEEFKNMIEQNNLVIQHFHEEEACFSGRFIK